MTLQPTPVQSAETAKRPATECSRFWIRPVADNTNSTRWMRWRGDRAGTARFPAPWSTQVGPALFPAYERPDARSSVTGWRYLGPGRFLSTPASHQTTTRSDGCRVRVERYLLKPVHEHNERVSICIVSGVYIHIRTFRFTQFLVARLGILTTRSGARNTRSTSL